MIVASFKDQFGTTLGTQLREWCRQYKWVLAWSMHSDSACLDPRRLLDPAVVVRSPAHCGYSSNSDRRSRWMTVCTFSLWSCTNLLL